MCAKRGKTPILAAAEAKRLIESIEDDSIIGLRDRALIAVMVYSASRISAAVSMNSEDLVKTAGRSWLRLHEKGGQGPRNAGASPVTRAPLGISGRNWTG